MANHASAIKRIRQNRKRRSYNRHYRSAMRTQIKNVRAAIEAQNLDEATTELDKAVSAIQRVASKGIIHPKNASRKVARLYAAVNKLKSEAAAG